MIDDDWVEVGPATLDRQVQYVWGARYIDDIILRRETPGPDSLDSYEHNWYHLTDHQFSTVALIDKRANLVERVTYNAYGLARHHWAGDVTGDGAVDVHDRTAMNAAYGERIIDPDYNVDADITRTGVVNSNDMDYTASANYEPALVPGRLAAPHGSGSANTIGYAGYVFNAEVPSIEGGGGLYTVRYRHYDPSLARWLERDPLGYVDGMSLYEYVQSSSVNAMDPLGLSPKAHWHHIVTQNLGKQYLRGHIHLLDEIWNGWYVSSNLHGFASRQQYLDAVEIELRKYDWRNMTDAQARRALKRIVKSIKNMPKFQHFFASGIAVDVPYKQRTKQHTARATSRLRGLGVLGTIAFGIIIVSDAHAQNEELLQLFGQFRRFARRGDYANALMVANELAILLDYLGWSKAALHKAIMDEYYHIGREVEEERRQRARQRAGECN